MPFIYEVNLEVQQEISRAFEQWLQPHITEMLTFDGFLRADWFERSSDNEERVANAALWTIQYHLDQRSSYQRYIEEHAERMRSDGLQRFAGKFTATRRLYTLKMSFQSKQ